MPRGKVQPRTGRAVNDSTLDDPAVREACDTGRPWALTKGGQDHDQDTLERDAVTIPIALGVLLALIGALCVLTWAFRLLRSVLVTL